MAFNIFIYNIFIFIHNNSIKATTMDVVVLSFYRIYRRNWIKTWIGAFERFIGVHWHTLASIKKKSIWLV